MLNRTCVAIPLAFLFLCCLPAHAQDAAVTGQIADETGGVVPGANVLLTNLNTNLSYSSVTNESGVYRVEALKPGMYRVNITKDGFKSIVKGDVELHVQDTLEINFELTVGSTAESVTVLGGAPTVQLDSAVISGVVNDTTVRELPLNGRDWTQLATLQPGVSTTFQMDLGINNDRGNRGLGKQMTIGGNRPQQNNYRLDGISVNDYSNGAPGSILGVSLGVDAVQEFSLIVNNAPAIQGRTSGGVINAVTRSGTNEFHGSAYEFLRNSALDAKNFFDAGAIPPFKRNQFGASAGGPLQRNRTFIFGDYEGLRQGLSITQEVPVPSAEAHAGNLCHLNVGCTQHQVSGAQNPDSATGIDKAVLPFLPLFPLPNTTQPLIGNGDTGIFNLPFQQITNENFFIIRADHKLSSNDTAFGTYMFDDGKTTAPDVYNDTLNASLSRRQAVILSEDHFFTPTILNSVHFGFSRVISEAPKVLSAINPLAADLTLGFVPGRAVGTINISDNSLQYPGGLGSAGEYDYHFNSFQVYDDVSVTKGRHSYKFGVAVERIQDNQLGRSNPNGQFNFKSLEDFLANKTPSGFNSALTGKVTPRDMRQTIFGIYVQDDWSLRPNLTLNLGLRYEMASVPTETNGQLSNLPDLLPGTPPSLGSPYFANSTKRNFEPRVGFSWDPFRNGKTSVRGAFGVYDVLPLPYMFELLSILSNPFYQQGALDSTQLAAGLFPTKAITLLTGADVHPRQAYIDSHPKRNYVLQWNFNVQREVAPDLTVFLGYVGSRSVHLPYHLEDFNMVLPTMTSAGWMWPGPLDSPGTKIRPDLGQIDGLNWNSYSTYHALQTQVTKRLSKGLQVGGSYTFSKIIDTGSSSLVADNFGNNSRRLFFDPKSGRGLADFDVRHNFTLNYVWYIPSPRSLGLLTHGWQLGGIFQAKSGFPFTPLIGGGGNIGMKSTEPFDYPNRITSPACSSLVNPGNPNHYFKTECFTLPSLPVSSALAANCFPNPAVILANGERECDNLYGNSGRGSVIGPGLTSFDTSLVKNTALPRISENFNVQFRAEFFNVLNHPNFNTPNVPSRIVFNGDLTTKGTGPGGAGSLTSTSTTSRQIQFGLKVSW